MTFETIRLLLIMIEKATESDIDDYRVIFYSFKPDVIYKVITYRDIPDCFNCKVRAFEFDLDSKLMYIKIKSEVVKHGKI